MIFLDIGHSCAVVVVVEFAGDSICIEKNVQMIDDELVAVVRNGRDNADSQLAPPTRLTHLHTVAHDSQTIATGPPGGSLSACFQLLSAILTNINQSKLLVYLIFLNLKFLNRFF